MICEVCGIEFDEWEEDLFDLCEECSLSLENEVEWIRENICEGFGR